MSQKQQFNQELLMFSVKTLLLKTYSICKKKWCSFIKTIIENKGIKRYALLMLLGFCNCIATTPFSVIAVLPLTFGSLFYIFDKCKNETKKQQTAIVFFFLLGHFSSVFWWMAIPATSKLSTLFWVIPLAIIGVPLLFSSIFSLLFFISMIFWNKFCRNKRYDMLYFALVFIMCWFLEEHIRGNYIFGGFPWMYFGHFVVYAFAIQAIRIFDIEIFSIFFLALVLVPYFWICKKSILTRQISFVIICAWIFNCVIGFLSIHIFKPKEFKMNILGSQLNVKAQLEYTKSWQRTQFEKRLHQISFLSKSLKPTLLLLPEAVIDENFYSGDNVLQSIGTLIPNDKSIMLFGGIYDGGGVSTYNVIYTINKYGDVVSLYKKEKLVPFGEYVPFRQYFPFMIHAITHSLIDFKTDIENNMLYVMYRDLPIIYPIICYEGIFPSYVKKNIKESRKKINSLSEEYRKNNKIKSIKERGEVIVNLTNDAWLKWSIGGYQHYLMVRFLAVSTNIPVIRLSNNGKSAYIDNFGIPHGETKMNKEDILFVRNLNKAVIG